VLLEAILAGQAGLASGILNSSRQIGGGLAVAVFGAMISHRASFLAGMRQYADCRPGAVRGYRAAALALPRLKAAERGGLQRGRNVSGTERTYA
jgi:MFS transporter, DHA2 family, methylenomycin A resistance protein